MWILHELNITPCGNIDFDRVNKLSLLNNSWKSLIWWWEGSLWHHHPPTHKCSKGRTTSDSLGQVHHWAVLAKVQSLSDAQSDQLSDSCVQIVGVFFLSLFFFSLSACLKKRNRTKILSERSDFPNLWWTGLNSCLESRVLSPASVRSCETGLFL